MQILNIFSKNVYIKDGKQKIDYYKVGFLKITDSGRKYIRLFQMPEKDFIVFDNKENNEGEGIENNEEGEESLL